MLSLTRPSSSHATALCLTGIGLEFVASAAKKVSCDRWAGGLIDVGWEIPAGMKPTAPTASPTELH